MKRKTLVLAIMGALGIAPRAFTKDSTAILYRMLAGFPGDVNRTHPASIEPVKIDASAPPTFYGQLVAVDPTTQGVRPVANADDATSNQYGITVRPYPFQPSSASNYGAAGFGAGTPPVAGLMDVLRSGYIMAPINGTPVKGARVYVWTSPDSGAHVQGGFETVDPATDGFVLPANTTFQGGVDANGTGEIVYNI